MSTKNIVVLATSSLSLAQSKSQHRAEKAQATIGVKAQGNDAEFILAMRSPRVDVVFVTTKGTELKATVTHGHIRGESELYSLFSEKQLKGGIEVKSFVRSEVVEGMDLDVKMW